VLLSSKIVPSAQGGSVLSPANVRGTVGKGTAKQGTQMLYLRSLKSSLAPAVKLVDLSKEQTFLRLGTARDKWPLNAFEDQPNVCEPTGVEPVLSRAPVRGTEVVCVFLKQPQMSGRCRRPKFVQ
jgi:hypothetical protein